MPEDYIEITHDVKASRNEVQDVSTSQSSHPLGKVAVCGKRAPSALVAHSAAISCWQKVNGREHRSCFVA